MKSIIITGEQNTGKTFLARKIASCFISEEIDINNIYGRYAFSPDIEIIILDELTLKDLPKFREIISKKSFRFRIPYSEKQYFEVSPIIIGVFQEHLPEFDQARHSFVFHLKKKL